MVARTAREIFGLERVIARIYDPRRAAIYEKLGIPTIATVQWTTDRVLRRILPDAPATEWTDPSAAVVLVERPVAPVVGRAVGSPTSTCPAWPGSPPSPASASARCPTPTSSPRRATSSTCPSSPSGSASSTRTSPAASHRRPRVKVVIVGGGNVGTFIAAELTEGGHEVTIIELEADRVARAEATGEPAGVRWVLADACEVDNLRKVPLDDVDVLAAVTGDDEDNLVVSLLAKQEFAVPRVIARVNNPKNHWMFNENWGVDVAVSTPHLLTSLVEEAVSVGTLVRLLSFERGRASLIEVTLAGRRQGRQPGHRRARLPARLHHRGRAPRGAGDLPPRRHAARCPATRCSCSSPPTARPTCRRSSPSGEATAMSTRRLILAALLCGIAILVGRRRSSSP